MRIHAREIFGLDLSEEETTKKLAEQFPALTEGLLELDFSQCLIDYKATSTLMDIALARLEQAPEPRQLVIVFNVRFHERLFLKWLFFGSSRLGLDVGALTDEEIRQRVVQGLDSLRVRLRIKVALDQDEYVAYSIENGH